MYRVGSSYLTWKRLCEYSARLNFLFPSERLAALIVGDFEKSLCFGGGLMMEIDFVVVVVGKNR